MSLIRRPYYEFLRVDGLNSRLYRLAEGARDKQSPHALDELHCVVRGEAVLVVDGDEHPASAGSIFYVRAGVPHRFTQIEEDLEVLVVFSSWNEDSKKP